jgi:hypothetical protein
VLLLVQRLGLAVEEQGRDISLGHSSRAFTCAWRRH